MEEPLNEFREILEPDSEESAENYIRGIRNGREWAGDTEIIVLMRVFNRPIVVVGPDWHIRNQINIQGFNGEPIFVLFNGHNHYDAFIQEEGVSSQEILSFLKRFNQRWQLK